MIDADPPAQAFAIFDELRDLALAEFCTLAGVEAGFVGILVEEGILEPPGHSPDAWRFSGPNVLRARRALRLREELELDWTGIALVLLMQDEIQALKRDQRALLRRLGN